MSGYHPAEQPAFEEYPAETGSAAAGAPPKHPVLLWLPLEPL
jgi:hypothetical protein